MTESRPEASEGEVVRLEGSADVGADVDSKVESKSADRESVEPVGDARGESREEVDDEEEDGAKHRRARSKTRWEVFDEWCIRAVRIVVIAGALFAGYEYYSAKASDRIAKTLEYAFAFERGLVAESQSAIRSAMRPAGEQFDSEMSEDGFERIILTIVYGDTGTPIANELDVVIDFFRGLHICIDEKLCDASVAKEYFAQPAKYYWKSFRPYIDDRRSENNPDFAIDLAWFVNASQSGELDDPVYTNAPQ